MKTLENFLIAVKDAAEAALIELQETPTEVIDEPKKTRKPKAKKEEVEESEEETTDDMGFGDEETTDNETTVSIDDVREAFKSFVAKHKDIKAGREAAMKVLTKYKAKKVDDLDEDVYAEVIETLKKKK